MGYRVACPDELPFEERRHREDEPPRGAADLTSILALRSSRARHWRDALFVSGAPPEQAGADFFPDVE